jgi:hypothetical protein
LGFTDTEGAVCWPIAEDEQPVHVDENVESKQASIAERQQMPVIMFNIITCPLKI